MRKKKAGGSASKQLVNLESSIKQLQSLQLDPATRNWFSSGGARGIRQRLLTVNFATLRNVADKVPIISAIVNTRVDQVSTFARYITEDQAREGERGFQIVSTNRRDSTKYDTDKADELGDFLEQTGFQFDPDRTDDLGDFIQMLTREVLLIDQVATEVQRNRVGEAVAFWLVDGATITRTNDQYPDKDIDYVQEIDQKVVAEYKGEDLIFDYKNKRADMRFRGYGYGAVEMCIDVVTTLLFGYNHLRDQFVKDKVPKGFIAVSGDIDGAGITAIQQYWYSAMSGAGGQWAIPILPSGKDGVGIEFKPLSQSNKDMEYHRLMMFLSSIIAAVFSIDLSELGIKADDSTSIFAGSSEPQIKNSKDRGLNSLLTFVESYLNKILRKVTTEYRVKISNIEPEDESRRADIRAKRLTTDTTIDELREKEGKEPFKQPWSEMPMNPTAVQIYMAATQAQAGMGQGGDDSDMSDLLGGGPENDELPEGMDNPDGENDDDLGMAKSEQDRAREWKALS